MRIQPYLPNLAALAFTLFANVAFAAELFTDAGQTTPGLTGSYVNRSLEMVTASNDWRVSQTISGTRIDPSLDFTTSSWGTRGPLGVTGGSDGDWENFSVQWDGWLHVTQPGQRYATVSDDGSRMWIDTDNDGNFEPEELLDNGWGSGQGVTIRDRSFPLAAGNYRIRIQYYEINGGNEFHFVNPSWVPRQFAPVVGNPRQVVKAIVLNYSPRIPSQGNKRLWEVFHWQDPRVLARQFEADLEYATGGAIDLQVVETRDLDEFPMFQDGFRYTADEYVHNWQTNSGWHSGVDMDFHHMARTQHLEELVNSGQIHEIWVFGAPYFQNFGETWMAGPNSFFINGPSFPDIGFERAVVGYGFNYERGVGEMVHNLCHRTENHGQRAFGSWNLADPVTAFDKFTANDLESPGKTAGVGSCHVPCNADGHYDYENSRQVASTAFDWANYPATTGATTTVSSATWKVGSAPDYQRDYLSFYFGMMPRNAGSAGDGRQANWFKYIWDFNSYEAGTGLPRNEDAFAAGSTVRTAGGSTQSFTVRYYDATSIDTATLDGSDVKVRTPGGSLLSAALMSVGVEKATTAGTARTVTYQVTAPGGSWDVSDSGNYTIVMQPGQVRDTSANAVMASDIGSFKVEIADPSTLPVASMLANGQVTVAHTDIDIGPILNLFDGSTSTLIRTPSINPASVTLTFAQPQTLRGFRTNFAHEADWTVETADSPADLDNHTGSWRQTAITSAVPDSYSTVMFATPVTTKLARLRMTRTTGDDYVHIYEWQLLGPVMIDAVAPTASAISPNVNQPGGTAQFITVTYTDDIAVDTTSLDSGDVIVTGPKGFSTPAVFYSVNDRFAGTPRVVTYWFVPPGGNWDSTDNGSYTLSLQAGQVTDTSGNASAAQSLGTFLVSIAPPARRPADDLAEGNSALWSTNAAGGSASVYNDIARVRKGNSSIRFETDGGFDTSLRFPPTGYADWYLTNANRLRFSVYAENTNDGGFQENSPWIRLTDVNGGWFEYRFYQDGSRADPINAAIGQWQTFDVPLRAEDSVIDGWRRTVFGTPSLDHIASIEFHADTWGEGFRLWVDDVGFDLPSENPWDNDLSVGWIQRTPSISYIWGSTNATRDGWPAEGSTVTWKAMVRNFSVVSKIGVSYRWLSNDSVIATGTADFAANGWTAVDLPRTWSFTREKLRFEIDSDSSVPEFSETNNSLEIHTDAISLGLWVEQSVYDYFHQYQWRLADGANGWEDWAQRQVRRWNSMFASAIDPIDAPLGVLDRIRLDKITVVPDGTLPLAGGLATNNPDRNDRTVDLMWGFPSQQLGSGFYSNHTARSDTNPFYYEGSLIHELGHARYLVDTYGFNVGDSAGNPRMLVRQGGLPIAGTPYLPRSYPWSDHVLIARDGTGNAFDGLMAGDYTRLDRYSAAAMNLIAGRRAVLGNYNAPDNIGTFINDLPAANSIQLFDGRGQPLAGAAVTIYQATGADEWYGKSFDDTPDLTFTADAAGRVQVVRNPFANGPLQHTYGISNMTALLKAEVGGRTGFAFIEAGIFNMEYWRGHSAQGRYSLAVPMIGGAREIVSIGSWPDDTGRWAHIVIGGSQQPQSVTISGVAAFYHEGAWLAHLPDGAETGIVNATWPTGPSVREWVDLRSALTLPTLTLGTQPGNPANAQFSWPTKSGHAYTLERSPDLLQWTPAASGTIFGTGDPFTVTEPKTGSRKFYRLNVRQLGN